MVEPHCESFATTVVAVGPDLPGKLIHTPRPKSSGTQVYNSEFAPGFSTGNLGKWLISISPRKSLLSPLCSHQLRYASGEPVTSANSEVRLRAHVTPTLVISAISVRDSGPERARKSTAVSILTARWMQNPDFRSSLNRFDSRKRCSAPKRVKLDASPRRLVQLQTFRIATNCTRSM